MRSGNHEADVNGPTRRSASQNKEGPRVSAKNTLARETLSGWVCFAPTGPALHGPEKFCVGFVVSVDYIAYAPPLAKKKRPIRDAS